MTAAIGLKRLGLALLAVLAVGIVIYAAASFLISADVVRRQVLSEIHAVTGLNPTLGGEATVSLFPTGSVSFSDVTLGDAKRPALTAERLTARLRFFPLLTGRVEISDVALERPVIAIDVEPNGNTNWSGLIKALTRSQNKGAIHVAAFSEMRIENGTVLVRSPSQNVDEVLTGVEFSLAWPSISKSFGATGRMTWHDEPLDVTIALSDFPAALAGNRSGLKSARRRQADEGRIRRRHQRQADAQDRRHARGRRHLDARRAGVERPEAAARRRVRPLRDQGTSQCDGRHDRPFQRQSRTRRQHRRGRAHLRHRRTQDTARHARLRVA